MYIKKNINRLLDSKYSVIKNLYEIPTYIGLPRISVCMAYGSNYYNGGFNASGAGISFDNAKLSAIGEYVERYCCLNPKKERLKKSIFANKKNYIDPNLFNFFKTKDYDFKKKEISWIKGYDLINKKICYIPAEASFLSFNDIKNERIWISNSTGAACGNTYEQVLWKGLAEVFERDAVQFTWRTGLKLEKINYKKNLKLKEFYNNYIKTKGITFHLFKLEMDWNLPAIFGIAEFDNGATVTGASVRGTWYEACEKTLIELSQSIIGYASVIYGTTRIKYDLTFDNIKNYEDHSILYFNKEMKKNLNFLLNSNLFFVIPAKESKKTDDEMITFLLNEVKKIEKKAYFIDMTLPDILEYGWKVGRVLVPSFLDIEPGFIKILKNNRIKEVKEYLLKEKLVDENRFTGSPVVPHPFP